MDITFKCPNCDQELEVDAAGAGSSIQCPSCFIAITVPGAGGESAPPPVPRAPAATPAPVEKHFSVPNHAAPADALIQKPNRPLEVAAKDSDKRMRIKTIKRTDCQEVGKDRFDEKVSDFLAQVGQDNIISINTISYSMIDMSTHAQLHDYGVLVVFKG